MTDIEPLPFGGRKRDAEALTVPAADVGRLTRPQRERRVRALVGCSRWIVDHAIAKHLDGHRLMGKVILFSGGNDSTTLAHMFRDTVTHAAHANTTIGVEETRQYVRDTCAAWGLPLIEKYPAIGSQYRRLVLDQGFPGPAQHFKMYQRLKERCLDQVRNDFICNPSKERVLFIAGRRRSESKRRAAVALTERKGSLIWASPLVLWTKLDLNTYRLMCGDVPVNQVSDLLHMSGECLCGSFAKQQELEMIGEFYPAVRQEIEALEAEIADREDIPEHARKWGWGAYRDDLMLLMQRGKIETGPLCDACDDRMATELDKAAA